MDKDIIFLCFFPNQQIWKPIITELEKTNNVIFSNQKFNKILYFFMKFHFSMTLNHYLNLPFKFIWYKYIIKMPKYDNGKKYIALFIEGTNISYDKTFLKYTRKKLQNISFVFYAINILPKKNKINVPNVSFLKSNYDVVVSFDEQDANDFNLHYHSGIYSKTSIDSNQEPVYDVFFIGKNKGRIHEIHKIYDELTNLNQKCLFYVTGVKKRDQLYPSINYNVKLSYNDVIKWIQKSKCILELIYENRNNATLRTREAIIYSKKLITNNKSIISESYYDSKYIYVLPSDYVISPQFVNNPGPVFYKNYKNNFSPFHFLHKIIGWVKECDEYDYSK